MSLPTSIQLYKTAAFLYGITCPAHAVFGFQKVYPALDKIPKASLDDRIAAKGSANCWNYLCTSLLTSALLNWQWARTAGPKTSEEQAIFFLTSIHSFVNGIRYLLVGEYGASTALISSSSVSMAAFLLQNK